MAWAKVATKIPIANWLGLSWRNVWTMRGENWPMANWTTTIVIVRTSAVRLTMDAATVERIASAASGPPVSVSGINSKSSEASMAIVAIDRRSPARTHTTGTNQMLERTLLNNRKSRTDGPLPIATSAT